MGGKRENSGRKSLPNNLKKNGTTIFNKCSVLLEYALKNYKEDNFENNIKFIDLFAGLGGIRIGFEKAFNEMGYKTKCVFASEIKKYAVEAYKHNFKDEVYGDITKIESKNIPDFDYLLAGFPCQPFSSAGNRKGFNDTRGTLFFEIERILRDKKPKGFILENVEGLINHNNGETLKTIIETLKSLGYRVNYKLIDSIEFGLAQSRKRVYIVGSKIIDINLDNFSKKYSIFKEVQETGKEIIKNEFTEKLFSYYKVEELYGKSIKDKRGGNDNIHSWDIELKGNVSEIQKRLLNKLLLERRKKNMGR